MNQKPEALTSCQWLLLERSFRIEREDPPLDGTSREMEGAMTQAYETVQVCVAEWLHRNGSNSPVVVGTPSTTLGSSAPSASMGRQSEEVSGHLSSRKSSRACALHRFAPFELEHGELRGAECSDIAQSTD